MLIDVEGNLNSKSEWRQNSNNKLVLEKPEWARKKEENEHKPRADELAKRILIISER